MLQDCDCCRVDIHVFAQRWHLSRTNLDASRGTEPMNKPPPRAGALRTTRESRLPSAACMVIVINKSGSAPTVTAQRPIAAVQDPASKQRS